MNDCPIILTFETSVIPDVTFCVASGAQSAGQSSTQASSHVNMQNEGFYAAQVSGSYNPLQQQAIGQSTQYNYPDPENPNNGNVSSLASYYNVDNQQHQQDQQPYQPQAQYSAPPISAPMQLDNNKKKESFCFLL